MKTLKKAKNPINTIQKVLSIGYKVTALLLFVFLFIGGISPARISEYNSRSVSLVKSAFYFQTYVQDVVDSTLSKKSESEVTDEFEESDSYDDFYANFEAMLADSDAFNAESTVSDDDSDLTFGSANKIKVKSFSKSWKNFSQNHPEVADAFNFAHIASVLTFITVLFTLLGVFLSFGSGLVKKIGYIVICAGSVFTALSMIGFPTAYANLTMAQDLFFDAKPMAPHGISLFVTISIVTFAIALATFIIDKVPADEKAAISERPFQYTYRVVALLLFVLLFLGRLLIFGALN